MHKKIFLLFVLFFLLAGSNCFAAFPIEVPLLNTPNPTLPQYIAFFFWWAMVLGGVLAVLSLVFNGIKFIISAGSPTGVSDAKDGAKSAVLGLILLLSSFIIITAINPKLEKLDPSESLRHIAIFVFGKSSSGTPQKPAPLSMENLDEIKKEYGVIKWNTAFTDLSGITISNCDPKNPNAVYLIYFYGMPNYNNFIRLSRIKCGQAVPLGMAKSYKIIKEEPGVYFFDGPNCSPQILSKYAAFKVYTESIPEDIGMGGQNVQSIRIVNGPDPISGPFFGYIYLNSTDYRTNDSNPFWFGPIEYEQRDKIIKQDNNSRCINLTSLPSRGVSWVIYRTVGFEEDGKTIASAGSGVTLFSDVSWSEGYYEIPIKSIGAGAWLDLRKIKINYPSNTKTPKERRDVCEFFNPVYSCLKSFEIKGNFLVIVISATTSTDKDHWNNHERVQVFPISSRLQEAYKNRPEGFSVERGTPEISSDYIGSKSAYYMEIIPLAERLR